MIRLCEMTEGKITCRAVPRPAFEEEYDVIVCGLGTAGSCAALFSAQNGLRVLGVEPFTCVGGTHTVGGVAAHYFGCPGGRHEALDQRVLDFTARFTGRPCESRKLLSEEAILAAGSDILYEAVVCGVYLEDNAVIGLRVLRRERIGEYGAKIVMDCTGDAHVAALAGCQTAYGRESDRQTQPYSLVSLTFDGEMFFFSNVDFGRVDQLDSAALSDAILYARSYKMEEGHAGKIPIAQMPILGLREGRRIIAEETVSLADLLCEKKTDTPAFYSYADLDKHGWDVAFDGEALGDWAVGANLGALNVTVAVPYKVILPRGFDGLLVPCRALGVDRDVASCVRMNPDMKKIAEVAAEWATLAVTQNKKLREIPYESLREKLLESGCLKPSDDRGCRIDGKRDWDGTPLIPKDVCWITDPSALGNALKTEKPGIAIHSAMRMGEKAVPTLLSLLAKTDENTVKHVAFALAALGRDEGIGVLRSMLSERDGVMLKDCRKHNNLRGCMAIYWLGRLGDAGSVEALTELICDEKELERPLYRQSGLQTTRYKIADFENIYFQFMSHAVMALVRIGERHPALRSRIGDAFVTAFSSDDYYRRITKRPIQTSEGNAVQSMKKIAFGAASRWNG